MIKILYPKGLIKSHYFAKAIANDRKDKLTDDSKAWAYYNLGMYKTVLTFPSKNLKEKGLVSKIISLAACGEFETTRILIKDYKKINNKKYLIRLVDSLSPFMPKDALDLLPYNTNDLLYSSILLKLGEDKKAMSTLSPLVSTKRYRKKPEILLYFSNSKVNIETKRKLKFLNMYLNLHDIPKVKLKNKSETLSIGNISSSYKKQIFEGPPVTVIMTSYNIASRIDTAIESILKQSYKNIELIIVDDASTDNTVEIIKNWKKIDSRISLISLKTNVGTYVAKNIGLLKCTGEFVTCHDSDDWSHPIKIERQVLPLIKNKKLVATVSSWIRIDDLGNYYARPIHPLSRINPSSLMFRKNIVLNKAGLWDCVRTGADSEYIARLKLIFGRLKVKRIKEVLSFGAHREDSLMTAKDTGYCEIGMSPQRLEYWEFWGEWHINELSKGKKPKLGLNLLDKRKFQAPNNILVPIEDIKSNLIDNKL